MHALRSLSQTLCYISGMTWSHRSHHCRRPDPQGSFHLQLERRVVPHWAFDFVSSWSGVIRFKTEELASRLLTESRQGFLQMRSLEPSQFLHTYYICSFKNLVSNSINWVHKKGGGVTPVNRHLATSTIGLLWVNGKVYARHYISFEQATLTRHFSEF